MKKFWIVFVIVAVLVGGGLGLLWRAATSLESPTAAKGGILHWQAAGSYPEGLSGDFMEQLQYGNATSLRQLVFGLKRASKDPDIKALVLDLRGLRVSWAELEEIYDAVTLVRESGKDVWACIESGGNADYALATAADHIALTPEGNLMVLGVAAELAFLKDTLAKAGLEADFIHVGQYKSAPEQLTRTGPSDANRAMTTSLVDERYHLLIDLIAQGREEDENTVKDWIDVGLYDGESALAAGLVDTLLDVEDLLADIYPDEEIADLDDYVRAGKRGSSEHEIALIVAAGTINTGESRRDGFQGQIMGSDTVVEQLADAREDEDVEAVLFRVNSPGGSALASDLIWREVERLRAVKPVIVSMGTYAASGGYYISCGADSIFADQGTLTGSIGVFAGKMSWSGFYDKIDLHREYITRGDNALLWHDAGGFTPSQRTQFQAQLDRFYERFLAKVAAGRDLTRDEAHAVAQGRVWTGKQALEAGLVDDLGGLDRALRSVKYAIGVDPDETVLVRTYSKQLTWFERTMLDALRSRSVGATVRRIHDPMVGLPAPLATMAQQLFSSGLTDVMPLLDGRPLALMPWRETQRPGSWGVTP